MCPVVCGLICDLGLFVLIVVTLFCLGFWLVVFAAGVAVVRLLFCSVVCWVGWGGFCLLDSVLILCCWCIPCLLSALRLFCFDICLCCVVYVVVLFELVWCCLCYLLRLI